MDRVTLDDAMWDFEMARVDNEYQSDQIKASQK